MLTNPLNFQKFTLVGHCVMGVSFNKTFRVNLNIAYIFLATFDTS